MPLASLWCAGSVLNAVHEMPVATSIGATTWSTGSTPLAQQVSRRSRMRLMVARTSGPPCACAGTHRRSRPCGLRGQGQGMVNALLAASPATRSRPRAIKGQEPGLVDVLLQPTEQTRSHRKAEVMNELLWVAGSANKASCETHRAATSGSARRQRGPT